LLSYSRERSSRFVRGRLSFRVNVAHPNRKRQAIGEKLEEGGGNERASWEARSTTGAREKKKNPRPSLGEAMDKGDEAEAEKKGIGDPTEKTN
jgi:hypothetical protein